VKKPKAPETVQEEVDSFLEDMRSTPPPAEEEDVKTRLLGTVHHARMKSGSFYVEELQRQMAARIEREAAEKIQAAIERARAAEGELKALRDERRKWWLDLAKTVVAALLIAALLFLIKQVAR